MIRAFLGLIGFFGSIPTLVKLFIWVRRMLKPYGEDPRVFLKDLSQGVRELSNSKTKEEKVEAGKKIQDLLRGL